MIKPIRIGSLLVGPGQPCIIIAEAGVNHNGDIELAKRLIEKAKDAGADAIKFQSFITEELITPEAPKANYQLMATGEPGSQYKMLKELELSADQQAELQEYCEKVAILYLCTPYEKTSIDMLDQMDVAAFKISSTDVTNIPFLRYISSKGRPVILSTGMSTLAEVEQAVDTLRIGGLDDRIVILHCTSEYPTPFSEVNLRAIPTIQKAFACPVGFSDHTSGIGASPWSVVLGACVIEKHFTLDRKMLGPDHRASIEPDELENLVRTIRNIEAAVGDGIKRPRSGELANKSLMQKSLVARRSIRAGETIQSNDITCKRPGVGLAPAWFDRVTGRRAAKDIPANSFLTLANVDWTDS